MSNLLRSEWIKIRTLRLNWILPLIGFAFVVVITGLIALFGEIDGFTTIESGEIAEIVGCPVGTAKVRAHRALRELRQIYNRMLSEASI